MPMVGWHLGKYLYCLYVNPISAVLEYRGTTIVVVALFEIFIFWFIRDWLTSFTTGNSWSKPLLSMIFAAPVAFFLWKFRNHDKTKELQHQKGELDLKENGDVWDRLVKFQNIISDKNASVTLKVTAIQGLGEFYKHKIFQFVQQVHQLFKTYLDIFWRDEESDPQSVEYTSPPAWLMTIGDVIRQQSFQKKNSFFNQDNKLSLIGFKLQYAKLYYINFTNADLRHVNFMQANLSNANFTDAKLNNAQFYCANLTNTNLEGADLTGTKLNSVKFNNSNLRNANFTDALLLGSDLRKAKNLETAIFKGAKFCYEEGFDNAFPHDSNPFPEGFNPKAHGMIEVDGDGDPVNPKITPSLKK